MSEIMRPIPFPELVTWVRNEFKNYGSAFGIRKEKFFRPAGGSGNCLELLGKKLSSPLGHAAGPNSQLAQNILASYLGGARFIELKTVQIMDGEELRKCVARPCINSTDEGYNVEWSTELTVPEAQEEYVKAWFLCHVFGKEFGITDKSDVLFNMSVGYSLDGVKSPKIDSYIEGLKNASNTAIWKTCCDYLAANLGSFTNFKKNDLEAISPAISDNVTLSTLHGCPKEEIEKIAAYLLSEKNLHTYIKCNPTLLGYESARRILDEMGYTYISFDDHHFKNDLQFNDAVEMLKRLMVMAAEKKLWFGVKITNTFPVQIKKNELPGNEMYMSGRSIFPLSITAARRLTEAFNGDLPISYSGGTDYFNLKEILETGIRPVTLATAILKPGGYERLSQLADLAEKTIGGKKAPAGIDVNAIKALTDSLPKKKRYRKEYRQTGSRKPMASSGMDDAFRHSIPVFDCFKAPCMETGCPIHQNIPSYLEAVAAENYKDAFKIIAKDNTSPSITGTICDHQCQHKCTRVDYDDPLQIRQAKLCAADNAQAAFTSSLSAPAAKTQKSAAVVGAGPAGIASAIFLKRNGVPVTVYEKREKPYGIVQYVIPSFRISNDAIARDFEMAEKLGVEFVFNTTVSSIADLKKKHEFVIIACGAWKEGADPVKQGKEKVIDALRFLEDSKKSNCALDLGKNVAVIGGGTVAMDCARAARRNKGVESVTIVYRRTREFMPSDYEEQVMALEDGVKFRELLAPESFNGSTLSCEVMTLGDYDASGRRGIEGSGKKEDLSFNTVIGAVGANVDSAIFSDNGIALNKKGLPEVNAAGETSVSGVYVAGDCKSGAATVVKAIAGGKAAVADILKKLGLEADFTAENKAPKCDMADLYLKKGVAAEAKKDNTDAYRCLTCNALCEICADVCPNRANVMVELNGTHQIVHIDRMCNECGNCAIFCPHTGKPYKDKFTVFLNQEDFKDSENPGFLRTGSGSCKIRLEDKSIVDFSKGGKNIPANWAAMIDTIETKYGYLIQNK